MYENESVLDAGIVYTVIRLLERECQKVDSIEAQKALGEIVNTLTLYLTPTVGNA